MKRTDEPNKCQCNFCRTYDRYTWAVVMECPCGCHKDNDSRPTGHDGMCCEFPNGRKVDNPYTDLLPASKYKEILDLMEWEGNLPLKDMAGRKGKEINEKIRRLVVEYKV